jgi:predicted RNase H-like nuclease
MSDSNLAIADARYGELLRLQFLLDDPNFTIEKLREYVIERTEEVYPHEYHVYRRRWERLAIGSTQGSAHWPKLEYLEWRRIVDALSEELGLSDLLNEGETAQAREYRAMLMLDQQDPS